MRWAAGPGEGTSPGRDSPTPTNTQSLQLPPQALWGAGGTGNLGMACPLTQVKSQNELGKNLGICPMTQFKRQNELGKNLGICRMTQFKSQSELGENLVMGSL